VVVLETVAIQSPNDSVLSGTLEKWCAPEIFWFASEAQLFTLV
jgi:hypothetical protein